MTIPSDKALCRCGHKAYRHATPTIRVKGKGDISNSPAICAGDENDPNSDCECVQFVRAD